MVYTKADGTNNHVIILLHGTGGDELSLFEVAKYIDKDATRIGFRGNVQEKEMNRFFKRYQDGTFDLKSLMQETKILYEDIEKVLEQNELTNHDITVLGYSNGANIAVNLLKEYTTNFKKVILLHPSPVRPEVAFKPQTGMSVFASYGNNDPYTTITEFEQLIAELEAQNIPTTVFTHDYGHQVIEDELLAAAKI